MSRSSLVTFRVALSDLLKNSGATICGTNSHVRVPNANRPSRSALVVLIGSAVSEMREGRRRRGRPRCWRWQPSAGAPRPGCRDGPEAPPTAGPATVPRPRPRCPDAPAAARRGPGAPASSSSASRATATWPPLNAATAARSGLHLALHLAQLEVGGYAQVPASLLHLEGGLLRLEALPRARARFSASVARAR